MAGISNSHIQKAIGGLSDILGAANPACTASLHMAAAKPLTQHYDSLPPLSDPAAQLMMMIGTRSQQDHPELIGISEALCLLGQDMFTASRTAPYAQEVPELERGAVLAFFFSELALPRYSSNAVDPDKTDFLCAPLAIFKRQATHVSAYSDAAIILNKLNQSRQNGCGIVMPPVPQTGSHLLPTAIKTFLTNAALYETKRVLRRASL